MKKRVAVLSYYSGGVERGVETWAKNLKKFSDLEITIYSAVKREPIFINTLLSCKKWLSADLVIPTNGRLQVLIVRVLTLIKGKPMVVFGHSGPGADDKWNLFCSPNVFVAFSEAQKRWAENHSMFWTRVVKIPHAVDTDKFTPPNRKPRSKNVLCVAANIPSKRVYLVQRAVKLLSGFNLRLVGKGFEGVEFNDMPKVYKSADIFCFVPERWEAFGLVFLEALASNVPVVTTDDPVRREIVGNAGVFIKNPQNADLLSEAIEKAYFKKWGNKPRAQAQKFSWREIINKYEDLFSEL